MWKIVLLCLFALYALWFAYLGVMNLKRAQDAGLLGKGLVAFAAPGVLLAITLDWCVNWIILTVILLEPPRELLVTSRLSRHLKRPVGSPLGRWRRLVAKLICEQLLDRFDPSGTHCGCKPVPPA